MRITFPFMDEDHLYKSHPSRYFAHLIGHEGPGSIMAYLKQKGWLIALSAGAVTVCPNVGLFYISMELTEEGLGKWDTTVLQVEHESLNTRTNRALR